MRPFIPVKEEPIEDRLNDLIGHAEGWKLIRITEVMVSNEDYAELKAKGKIPYPGPVCNVKILPWDNTYNG